MLMLMLWWLMMIKIMIGFQFGSAPKATRSMIASHGGCGCWPAMIRVLGILLHAHPFQDGCALVWLGWYNKRHGITTEQHEGWKTRKVWSDEQEIFVNVLTDDWTMESTLLAGLLISRGNVRPTINTKNAFYYGFLVGTILVRRENACNVVLYHSRGSRTCGKQIFREFYFSAQTKPFGTWTKCPMSYNYFDVAAVVIRSVKCFQTSGGVLRDWDYCASFDPRNNNNSIRKSSTYGFYDQTHSVPSDWK